MLFLEGVDVCSLDNLEAAIFCFLFIFVYVMEDWLRSSFLSGVVGTSRPPLQLCKCISYAFYGAF